MKPCAHLHANEFPVEVTISTNERGKFGVYVGRGEGDRGEERGRAKEGEKELIRR